MSQLPSEGDNTKEKKDALFKELQDNVYKCYKCGKTELGKNLDGLYSISVGKKEGWFFEWEGDGKIEIGQAPPSYNPNIVQCYSTKAYCDICGKIRERELELLDIEVRKVKASEKIGSALEKIGKTSENIDNMAVVMANIGTALENIGRELERFNNHHGYRG